MPELKLFGRLGWSWIHSGELWHTDADGSGLYCKGYLVDRDFVAPRSRTEMIKFLAKGELNG